LRRMPGALAQFASTFAPGPSAQCWSAANKNLVNWIPSIRTNRPATKGASKPLCHAEARLRLLSRTNVLERGYSSPRDAATVKSSATQGRLSQGQPLKTRLKKGRSAAWWRTGPGAISASEPDPSPPQNIQHRTSNATKIETGRVGMLAFGRFGCRSWMLVFCRHNTFAQMTDFR